MCERWDCRITTLLVLLEIIRGSRPAAQPPRCQCEGPASPGQPRPRMATQGPRVLRAFLATLAWLCSVPRVILRPPKLSYLRPGSAVLALFLARCLCEPSVLHGPGFLYISGFHWTPGMIPPGKGCTLTLRCRG